MWYFNGVSLCHFQTYRSNIRNVNIPILIWRHICFAMASLTAHCTFKIVNVSQQRWPFVLTKLLTFQFIFNLLLSYFHLLISSDSLIFLLLYLACFDVFGCSQLNWPWHFKQCFVAPELSHFPFMPSCWCSIVTFFLFHRSNLRYNCSLIHQYQGKN